MFELGVLRSSVFDILGHLLECLPITIVTVCSVRIKTAFGQPFGKSPSRKSFDDVRMREWMQNVNNLQGRSVKSKKLRQLSCIQV